MTCGSRQLSSFSLAMGFRDPNLLRAAVIGERPKTLQSSRADPHRRPGRRLCQLLALFGHAAMSDLSPQCASKWTVESFKQKGLALAPFPMPDIFVPKRPFPPH